MGVFLVPPAFLRPFLRFTVDLSSEHLEHGSDGGVVGFGEILAVDIRENHFEQSARLFVGEHTDGCHEISEQDEALLIFSHSLCLLYLDASTNFRMSPRRYFALLPTLWTFK